MNPAMTTGKEPAIDWSPMEKDVKKSVWGWAIYDWANSAFATTVMAGFFPVFFKEFWSAGVDVNVSTARLGFGVALASLIIAVSSPFLGAIADHGKVKKRFLFLFVYFGVFMTVILFFIPEGKWLWAILAYTLCIVGWYAADIFYNAFLPELVSEHRLDYVSSLGYSVGYLGGGLLFAFNVWMTLNPEFFGLLNTVEAVRFSFLSVAIWWGGFSIITFIWVKEEKNGRGKTGFFATAKGGFLQLKSTFQKIRHMKTVFLFLLAYWFYIDGVDTVFVMAVDYGISIGFKSSDLILALLITQFVGFPCTLLIAKFGGRFGVKKALYFTISVYIVICLWGMLMQQQWEFFALATIIGTVQGGIQALSRSFFAKLIPVNQAAEFFGFYNMLGKFAAILGPALMAIIGLAVKRILEPSPTEMLAAGQIASRASIASIILLFLAGGILLSMVNEKKGKEERAILSETTIG